MAGVLPKSALQINPLYLVTMKYLNYEKAEHLGIIKFSRKEVLNALNRDLLEEFYLFLELIAKGEQIKALVITGEGDQAFSVGADLKNMQAMSQHEVLRFFEFGQKIADELQKAPFLTIAAVNGYALGGGFEMALACDFIYASETAVFGLPEVQLGLIPSFGGTQRLSEAIGARLAKEWIMTGKKIKAKEAYDVHIVNKICSPNNLLKESCEIAAEILTHPFHACLQAKKAINLATSLKREALEAERNMAALCFESDECKQKIKKFTHAK